MVSRLRGILIAPISGELIRLGLMLPGGDMADTGKLYLGTAIHHHQYLRCIDSGA